MKWAMEVRTGKASDKAVLIALAHCHHSKTGKCHPSVATISEMTELNRKTVMPALDRLRISGLIDFDPRNRSNRSYALNLDAQSPKNGTTEKQGCSASFGTKKAKSQSPKKGQSKSQKGTNEVPKTGHNKEDKENKELYKSEHVDLARWMWGKVQAVTQSDKQPNFNTWATDLRKLNEIDKRDIRLIAEVFDWANRDSFWQSNILSPAKLRKQFDTLYPKFKAQRDEKDQRPTGHGGQPSAAKLTPAQRIAAKRERLRQSQSPDLGTVAADGGDVRPPVVIPAG